MNQVRRPNQKILVDVFSGKNRTLYAKLESLIKQDLNRKQKKNHWIWYMYPQSKEAVEGTPAHHEYEEETAFLSIFFSDKYQKLFKMVNKQPLEWFPAIDRIRVSHFRSLHSDLIATPVSGTAAGFRDCAK